MGHVEPGRPPAEYQVYFVKSNFHDNRGLDGRIVLWLQSRGFKAEKGPMTMMPASAQALVTYDDHWNWDFTTHLTWMRIEIVDARSDRPVGAATFSGPAALTISVDKVIDRLMTKMFSPDQRTKKD